MKVDKDGNYVQGSWSEWIEENIGKEGLSLLTKMANEGYDFALKFLEDPKHFCETNTFKVYMGFGINRDLGMTYAVVHKIKDDSFAILWTFLDGSAPSIVVTEKALHNIIKQYDFSRIDNEIFMIWLNDNLEILKKAHNIYVDELEKVTER